MKFDNLTNSQENVQYLISIWAIELEQFSPTDISNLELESVLLYHNF